MDLPRTTDRAELRAKNKRILDKAGIVWQNYVLIRFWELGRWLRRTGKTGRRCLRAGVLFAPARERFPNSMTFSNTTMIFLSLARILRSRTRLVPIFIGPSLRSAPAKCCSIHQIMKKPCMNFPCRISVSLSIFGPLAAPSSRRHRQTNT